MKYYDTVIMATCYIPALINDDPTNLDDAEIAQLDLWVTTKCPGKYTFHISEYNEFFGRDCVSGLMATCISIDIYSL